jgi:Anti-sigma-K factor rskA
VMDHAEARLLLADLVIDDLADPSRVHELHAHVAACAACRAELAELRRLDGLMRAAGPLAVPSPQLAARVAALVTTPPVTEPAPAPAPVRGRWWPRTGWLRGACWPLATATSLALSIVLGLALVNTGSPAMTVTAHSELVPAPAWASTYGTADLGRLNGRPVLRVRAYAMPRLVGSYYELWIAASPSDRISLGVLVPDASGRLDATIPLPQLPPGYRGVWITRQPQEGGPGWTSDWVLAQQL